MVDIERVVGGKVSPGGTAPRRVDEQLALARAVLDGIAWRAYRRLRPGAAPAVPGRPSSGLVRCRMASDRHLRARSRRHRGRPSWRRSRRGGILQSSFFARPSDEVAARSDRQGAVAPGVGGGRLTEVEAYLPEGTPPLTPHAVQRGATRPCSVRRAPSTCSSAMGSITCSTWSATGLEWAPRCSIRAMEAVDKSHADARRAGPLQPKSYCGPGRVGCFPGRASRAQRAEPRARARACSCGRRLKISGGYDDKDRYHPRSGRCPLRYHAQRAVTV